MPDDTLAPVGAPDTSVAEDAAPEWDGSDWSVLDKQPWWSQVPESARGHITKAHEERTSAKERADYLDRLFGSDDDTLRKDLETTQAERDALKAERDGLAESLRGIESRAEDEAAEREYVRREAAYPDIFADIHLDEKGNIVEKGAFARFAKLINAGFEEGEAAAMARAVMINKPGAAGAPAEPAAPAGPPKTREVKAPPSIAQASRGGNNPSSTVNMRDANEDIDQRAARIQREFSEQEKRASG